MKSYDNGCEIHNEANFHLRTVSRQRGCMYGLIFKIADTNEKNCPSRASQSHTTVLEQLWNIWFLVGKL